MTTRRAVIVDVVRSPFGKGKAGGALDGLHPVDLYAQILQGLVARTAIDPALIEDVITGCVIQVGEQAGNIGRQAVLAAGDLQAHVHGRVDLVDASAQLAYSLSAPALALRTKFCRSSSKLRACGCISG